MSSEEVRAGARGTRGDRLVVGLFVLVGALLVLVGATGAGLLVLAFFAGAWLIMRRQRRPHPDRTGPDAISEGTGPDGRSTALVLLGRRVEHAERAALAAGMAGLSGALLWEPAVLIAQGGRPGVLGSVVGTAGTLGVLFFGWSALLGLGGAVRPGGLFLTPEHITFVAGLREVQVAWDDIESLATWGEQGAVHLAVRRSPSARLTRRPGPLERVQRRAVGYDVVVPIGVLAPRPARVADAVERCARGPDQRRRLTAPGGADALLNDQGRAEA